VSYLERQGCGPLALGVKTPNDARMAPTLARRASATRPAAVAGAFYPDDPGELAATVDRLLERARRYAGPAPKALVVPHAGYVYSGAIAASGYACIVPSAQRLRHVVLFGPAHRVPVHGCALPGASSFATPLGSVPVDVDLAARLAELPGVTTSARAHQLEHSLEVQLPFLQRILPSFTVLPIAVGYAEPSDVANVLDAAWGDASTLVVISSDLSHYLPYADACSIDRATAERIVDLDVRPLDQHEACGATPVSALLIAARRRGLGATLVDLCNSGDTAGSRDQVVGYGAFAFHPLS